MLTLVDLNTDTLHDALESLDTVLIPWLESREPSLSEEDLERQYVRMALQVIDQHDPDLDEAKRTYYVYQLVVVLKELVKSPNLQDIVSALRAEHDVVQLQATSIAINKFSELEPGVRALAEALSHQRTAPQALMGATKQAAPSVGVGRLPDLPTGQPLRERRQVRYDVTPQPSDH